MRNIQVCNDVGTLFIDRDGTTVLLEKNVYINTLASYDWGPGWCKTLLLPFYQWSSAHGFSLDEEPLVQLIFFFFSN